MTPLKLRYKLFLVVLLANALLIGAIWAANYRAFSTSFDTYLNQIQARRLAPLLEGLAQEYQTHGSWRWLEQDPEQWQPLIRRHLFARQEEREGRGGPRRRGFQLIELRDAQGHEVIGSRRSREQQVWLPILVGNQRVGELGVPVSLRLTSEFDQLFAEQQQRQLLWIALLGLLLAALIALPFAQALARPISRLQRATGQLARGHYDLSLPTRGSDELAELARDFNALARHLQQNLQARQQWIADIAHELRTPVAVLQAELESILDGIRAPDEATVTSLHQEVQRLGSLIQDLHELSLSDAGALSYQKVRTDLVALIESVCAHRQSTLEQRGIQRQFNHPGGPVWVLGDPNRLRQLFTNLLENSLHYTDSAPDAPGRIEIELVSRGGQWQLHWSDSAPEVPQQSLPYLFDRLYRVEGSRNRREGGSGLGLAIARNVVEAHGGQIHASPSRLGGLTLALTLPEYPATD